MTTLLVHDGSPTACALAAELDVGAIDGRTTDDEALHSLCRSSDRVVFASTGWDEETALRESRQVDVLISALNGSGKRLVYLSDATVIGDTGGSFGNEDSPRASDAPHRWRVEAEERVEQAINDGVYSLIVRLAVVHGHHAGTLVEQLTSHALRTGQSVYVEDGISRVSTVHIDDVVSLVRLALQRAPQGVHLVAASDEVVSWHDLAAVVATGTAATPVSISAEAATAVGLDGATMAVANVMRDHSAARRLGWRASGSRFCQGAAQAPVG